MEQQKGKENCNTMASSNLVEETDVDNSFEAGPSNNVESITEQLGSFTIQDYVETWKPLVDDIYGGSFEVSTFGRIRNLRTGRILTASLRTRENKYLAVSLCKNNIKKTVNVHIAVAKTYLNWTLSSGLVVNHIDGNTQNNHLSNLEIVTYQQNNIHAIQTGLTSSTRRSCKKKCPPPKYYVIFEEYPRYMITHTGKCYNTKSGRYCRVNKKGPSKGCVVLKDKDGNIKTLKIHFLVMWAFGDDQPKDKKLIRHIDGDFFNNHIRNLQWASHKDIRFYREDKDVKVYTRVVVQYDDEWNEIDTFNSLKDAYIKTGVDDSSISKACQGKNKNKKGPHRAGDYFWKYKYEERHPDEKNGS